MNKLSDYLVKQNIINEEDQEICDYGVFVVLFNGLTIITTLILGIILFDWQFSLYFLIFYSPFRMLLGGGHCQTPQRCFVFTHIDLIIVFIIGLFFPSLILNVVSILCISIATVLYLLSDKNKIYKIILLIFYIIDLFVFINFNYLRLSISCAFLLSAYLYFSDKITFRIKRLKKGTVTKLSD